MQIFVWYMYLASCFSYLFANADTSSVRIGHLPLIMTPNGPHNLLPAFNFILHGGEAVQHVEVDKTPPDIDPEFSPTFNGMSLNMPDDMFQHLLKPHGVMPYRLIDGYRGIPLNDGKAINVSTIDLVGGGLKASFTPQWGGKIWSLTDAETGRDLIFSSPWHQSGPYSVRNAQVDGGVEWNWSPGRVGHWAGTQENVSAGIVETEQGDVLRIFAFDRFNHTAFQVDSIIINGTLFSHAKVINPNPKPIRGYWWTNVAHRLLAANHPCRSAHPKGSRVLLPAKEQVNTAAGYSPGGWPLFNEHCCPSAGDHYQKYGPAVDQSFGGRDMSFLENWDRFADVFSRINTTKQRPFVGLADRELYAEHHGLIHGHSLNGSKIYVGGASGGAQAAQRWYMQEYDPVSKSHDPDAPSSGSTGCFLELQTGVAQTQSQYFPMEGNSSLEWTEYFKTMKDLNKSSSEELFSEDYDIAMDVVNEWLESPQGVPRATFDSVDKFLREISIKPITTLISVGTPYGALHEKLTGKRISPSMSFEIASADQEEVQPWLDLLDMGTFSSASLEAIPLSFMVHDDWVTLLHESVSKHGATYLHHLHLGHAAADQRDYDGAVAAFNASLLMRPTALVHRNLAVTLDDDNARWSHYQAAWKLALNDDRKHAKNLQRNLAMEMGGFLLAKPVLEKTFGDSFIKGLDEAAGCQKGSLCESDQVALLVLYQKQAAGNASDVLEFLQKWHFITPPQTLASFTGSGLWEKMVVQVAEETAGRPLSQLERKHAMLARPPPRRLLPL